jgi:hypothetical protein
MARITMRRYPRFLTGCHYRRQTLHFDLTQASLVFINTCFALAFGSLYTLLQAGYSSSGVHRVAAFLWAGVAGHIAYNVWRQYSIYYIPLQFHSQRLESATEEFTTLSITACIALIALNADRRPIITECLLLTLLILNLRKVKQMCGTLEGKAAESVALKELSYFRKRLTFYIWLLGAISIFTITWPGHWDPAKLAIVLAIAAFLCAFLTPRAYRALFREEPIGPDEYRRCLAELWQTGV